MGKLFLRAYIFVCVVLFPIVTNADALIGGSGRTVGLGEAAASAISGPLASLHHFMNGAFFVIGFIALILGVKKSRGYWFNPLECPLTFCIGYFIVGILMISVPFIHYLTDIEKVVNI